MLKSLVVLFSVLAVSLAALAIYPLDPKPEKFKDDIGCYIKETDEVIPFGSSKPSQEQCMQYRCSESQVTRETCGVVDAQPPCRVVTNKELPYPGCCPEIVCPP
ncbi:venom toxin OcyC11 isoform X2 [Plutella xylostella]|uniref:venom toxin OcyC11 isoform X2 n=1 Tax=Plutella xylostella TaxID=51655 RepID=UPI00203315EA|nr:venom toxin OcyC11 isoform X2 [Plutella xylostella]